VNRKQLKSLAICAAALAVICCATFITFAAPAPQGSGYHLVKKVAIGGDTAWDYVYAEPTTHRVFISHGTHTVVTDAQGTVLGDIPDTKGVHGIATATEFNRGFTSNGQANSVTVFDLTTLKTINEIKIEGQNPDAILYDSASKRVFTFNGRSGDSTAIDAKTGDIAGSIKLTGKPETAQADGEGHVFVNIEDKNQIIEFDSKKLSVMNTWTIAPCKSPSGLAFDVAHKRLFAGCDEKITAVVDATNGKVVATIPIGDGVDANGFDPATGFVFASCGDGTLTVAHEDSPDKYTVVETIHTPVRARTMTVDTGNHNLYTVTAEYGQPTPPPAGSPAGTRGGRAPMVPGSFSLLIYGR
jgi:DNA-binding beta-propeller fold protein YncE